MGAVAIVEPLPAPSGAVHVTIMPSFDPGERRVTLTLAPGVSIADILAAGIQQPPPPERLRVFLVSDKVYWPVERDKWPRVKPKAGVHVIVRVVPAGLAIVPVLNMLITVAAQAAVAGIPGIGPLMSNLLVFAIPPTGGLIKLPT